MRLSSEQLSAAEAALASDDATQLIDLMRRVALLEPLDPIDDSVKQSARDLGWLASSLRPTSIGEKVADSMREYSLWIERGRCIHQWGEMPLLQEDRFRQKRVLELGSGFGCNLIPLAQYASEVVGVDVEPVYLQLSGPLAQLAGVEPPRIIEASATQVPLPDGNFDVVLCFGALQYMPIEEVLLETSRLLKPGGDALFGTCDLGGYLGHRGQNLRDVLAPRLLARELVTVAGMVLYPWIGRAFTRPFDPVYSTHRWMERWMGAAGLRLDWSQTRRFGYETAYVATKAAA